MLYYAPRIFGDMGMTDPMVNTVVMGVVNILFTLVAIFTVESGPAGRCSSPAA